MMRRKRRGRAGGDDWHCKVGNLAWWMVRGGEHACDFWVDSGMPWFMVDIKGR